MNKPRLALVCVLLAAIAVANPYVHAAQDTDDGETVSIWVETILVSPSEILTDYEIAAVVTPYEGRELRSLISTKSGTAQPDVRG